MVNGIEDSSNGKKNRHYIACAEVGQRRPYAGCIARLTATEGVDPTCERAMRCGTCVAKNMRDEELELGGALYYDERPAVALVDQRASGSMSAAFAMLRAGNTVPSTKTAREEAPTPQPIIAKAEPKNVFGPIDYSAVVDVALARSNAASAPVKPTGLDIRPGESPIEALRRRQQLNKV